MNFPAEENFAEHYYNCVTWGEDNGKMGSERHYNDTVLTTESTKQTQSGNGCNRRESRWRKVNLYVFIKHAKHVTRSMGLLEQLDYCGVVLAHLINSRVMQMPTEEYQQSY